MKIDVLVFDGFDELDAIAPYEVLHNAMDFGADIKLRLVTIEPQTEVTASHGLRMVPHGVLDVEQPLDVLIVPGGGWGNRADRGAWGEAQNGTIPKAIAKLHSQGTTIASVCTGGMLVAYAGLLKDRPAITHQVAIADLEAAGAQLKDARIVDDGDIVSAGGVTSGIDMTLWLVERFFGKKIAADVEEELEYQRQGVLWQRADS